MASDLSQLESRYCNACQKQEVLPNSSILSCLSKVKHQKVHFEQCSLEILIDNLTFSDIPPLIDTLSGISSSDVDAVDVSQKSSDVSIDGESLLLLLRAVNHKLRAVNFINSSFWKDVLRDIFQRGTTCQVLNLRFSPIRKLNMTGKFMELHTLNLDFSVHLNSFHINCFSCMPKLMRLSMCETRVANLWITSAALSKLRSLVELRFQTCLCCFDTGPCPTSGGVIRLGNEKIFSDKQQFSSYLGSRCVDNDDMLEQTMEHSTDDTLGRLCSDNLSFLNHDSLKSTTQVLSDESDSEFSSDTKEVDNLRKISDPVIEFNNQANSNVIVSPSKHSTPSSIISSVPTLIPTFEEVMSSSRRLNDSNSFIGHANADEFCCQHNYIDNFTITEEFSKDEGSLTNSLKVKNVTMTSLKNHISSHPSPICFETYYKEYMITSLPNLLVLDNLPIGDVEREQAKLVFKRYFERAPYNRRGKDSVVSIVQRREISSGVFFQRSSKVKQRYLRESNHSFLRSLSAAKVNSSPQPHSHSISNFRSGPSEETKSFRPRQFEYHPTDPRLMVFGTLDGELVVLNHESEKLVGYLPSVGMTLNSILGLCWLKKHPSKLIAGSDNGSLQMYDVCRMLSKVTDRYCNMDASMHTFDDFEQLTSVHINSNDEYILASGFSNHVALYDMCSGRRLQIFKDLHKEHINVVKFAYHSPTLFATASFDKDVKMWDLRQGTSQPCYTASSSRGNVMVCFSPDDYYLLTSAIDNEVKQLLAVDGRLLTSFDITSTGNAQNYTRSYYMNGRDYMITGSCEEHVVRICCAQTGRRLKDVHLEGRGSKNSIFIQSLRSDPFRAFHMSILAAHWHPFTKSEIIKVNLLQTEECIEESTSG
ncbi:protein DWD HYPERSENSITIVE TO UV-B 1-like isoform X2 [Musa acuminata AAA Group]|uniref:protein DWD HYPERSENSITIVE TO UV-B 1-like isoform X2 n=1 Tax=Musa acuminata AAA Group TaxID=214697 RepID=UPI0031D04E58